MSKMIKYYNGNLVEYEIFKLVDFYDDILKTPTVPWDFNTRPHSESESLAFSLAETMSKLGGLGLSANQVGLKDRVCVINMGTEAWVMFNPKIVSKSETPSNFSEGCLSYPGLFLKLARSNNIKVQFQTAGGDVIEKEFDGLTAVCVQHEIDHLDGIRYTDKVSPIKLEQAKRKVKKTLKKMSHVTVEDLKRAGLA
jgi:peptide deformylase